MIRTLHVCGFAYNKYFTGPFHNNQILDTVETVIYPHIGYLNENVFNLNYMCLAPNTSERGFDAAFFSSNNILDEINCWLFEPVEVTLE